MTRSPGVRTKCTRSTEGKNKIARLWYCINSYPWEFPPPRPHHLDLGQCRYNTSSATIALTATSPTIILPLGSVRFLVFHEESYYFYRQNFVTRQPSWPRRGKMGFQGRWVHFYMQSSAIFPHKSLTFFPCCSSLGGCLAFARLPANCFRWWCFTS